ncbi:regulatory protein [Natranaerovirga pectinivora]|uniref:Regulatory protein RecX n=1 Tax=Natranaerovirga pectinivora TaxID=682400 RepID=A0A4R3MNR9_9FIRM|nr:regulatory protein RecX [Natranaerovirga pectinivora]TCT15030.1 regulatory protein [Natranaerovirga pectinivora]
MEVTELIVDPKKDRISVYFNDEYFFWLTNKEIKKLDIKEEQELSLERINSIIDNIVYKKAKSKALNYIKYCDRTEQDVCLKLKKEGFIDLVIQKVIFFCKDYHIIDDYRYATNYLNAKKEKKSLYQIKYELKNKGVSDSIISDVLKDIEVNEEEIIKTLIHKKTKNHTSNKESIQKLYYYLVRKGFNPSLVMKIIKENEQNK